MSIQKLFRYLMFIWILLLLFLMLVVKSNMILTNNQKNFDLFDLFFDLHSNGESDFLLQEKLVKPVIDNDNKIDVPQIETPKISKNWVDIPLNKTLGDAHVNDITISENLTTNNNSNNNNSVDIILTYVGTLGGYTGASIFSNTNPNIIIGKFVDLHGKWNEVEKVFHNKNQPQELYNKIMVYKHSDFLRITLESPQHKYTSDNVFKVKAQKNSAENNSNNNNVNKVKISFYY